MEIKYVKDWDTMSQRKRTGQEGHGWGPLSPGHSDQKEEGGSQEKSRCWDTAMHSWGAESPVQQPKATTFDHQPGPAGRWWGKQ